MNEKVIACIPSKTMRNFLTVNNFEMSALQAERASKEKLTRKQRNIYGGIRAILSIMQLRKENRECRRMKKLSH